MFGYVRVVPAAAKVYTAIVRGSVAMLDGNAPRPIAISTRGKYSRTSPPGEGGAELEDT
jgi:hypothetical protein